MNLSSLIASLVVVLPLLAVLGPVIGEMAATMAPIPTDRTSFSIPPLDLTYEEVSFSAVDGIVLRGWFFPAENAHGPAVIYAPATGQDQRSGLSLVEPLHQAGYHVLLFSYRGTGISDGNRTGFTYGYNESKDIDAAVDYLSKVRGIRQVGAIGHSAGAVSILLSAADNPSIRAIIAASPYPSLDEIWETNRPSFFPKPLYHLVMRLAELRKGFSRQDVHAEAVLSTISPRPILFFHGSEDRRVTLSQARRMFAQAQGPKKFILLRGATHHQVRVPGLDNQISTIIHFFDQFLKTGMMKPIYVTPVAN